MRRVDEQRAGDRDALAFAARQRLAAFADQRVVAVRQAQDELVGVRGAGGGDDLGARGVGLAVGDVLGNGAEEQEGFLQHQADVRRYSATGSERMSTPSIRMAPSVTS
jgi:hypothetical protein